MFDLLIARGARLLAAPPDLATGAPAEEAPALRQVDVTRDAAAYLFDPVQLEEGATLADVLGLFTACPLLRHVFERDFAHEYAEALTSSAPGAFGVLPPPDAQLKRLEVQRVRQFNSAQCVEESQSWHFHGIGPAPAQEEEGSASPAADLEDVKWGLSLGELGPLLALPVVVSNQAVECEADPHSLRFGAALRTYGVGAPTLGELLRAILYELSFHGDPTQRVQTFNQVKDLASEALEFARSGEVEAGGPADAEKASGAWTASTVLWLDYDRRAAARLFVPGYPQGDDALAHVFSVVRSIPDADPVCAALAALAPEWVLSEAFAGLNGRDLREAAFDAGLPAKAGVEGSP